MHARSLLEDLHRAGVAAVEPRAAVLAHCEGTGERLRIDDRDWDLSSLERVVVVGAGKASAPMVAALEELLGDRIDAGLVVVKDGHTEQLRHTEQREASHPVPDQRSVAAAQDMLALLADCGERDLVINCLSGGASALLTAPRAPMDLAALQALTDALLASGADIHALNCLRRHCSRIKGGGLARAASPAALVNLIISDVVGDELSSIGSGPGVGDPTSLADARALYERHLSDRDLPESIAQVLADPSSETPTPEDPLFERVQNCLVATNAQAQAAVRHVARERDLLVQDWPQAVAGDALDFAADFVTRARALQEAGRQPAVLLAGGEPVLHLSADPGRGGRAQAFALAAARALQGTQGITVLGAGTDGSDGPTDACGALADGATWAAARAAGFDPQHHLDHDDAYPLLDAIGKLYRTGPTRTNVMDLYLALIG
ncbi:MAG: glycerate kinase type-2 family protein [Planctomycetota bacterium]